LFLALLCSLLLGALAIWFPAFCQEALSRFASIFGPNIKPSGAIGLLLLVNAEAYVLWRLVKGATRWANVALFLLLVSLEMGAFVFLVRLYR
jgi:hypothetical protein